jgi:hypothetical protein
MSIQWIEVALAAIATVGSGITAIRYVIGQMSKMQKAFLNSQENQQKTLFEYVETKNGHMERVANRFSASSDLMAEKIGDLNTSIQVLREIARK